jgi:hypothetical protein
MAAADDTLFESSNRASGLAEPYGPLADAFARIGRASREDRAGFRKAVGVATLMDGADMFHALRSDDGLRRWRARRAIRLQV